MMTVTYTFACYACMPTYGVHITDFYFCRQIGMNTVLCNGELVLW